jgi:hypothetical protein
MPFSVARKYFDEVKQILKPPFKDHQQAALSTLSSGLSELTNSLAVENHSIRMELVKVQRELEDIRSDVRRARNPY